MFLGRIDQPTTPPPPDYDEIAQMLERRIVEPEVPDSNPPSGKFFCAVLQRVTSGPCSVKITSLTLSTTKREIDSGTLVVQFDQTFHLLHTWDWDFFSQLSLLPPNSICSQGDERVRNGPYFQFFIINY